MQVLKKAVTTVSTSGIEASAPAERIAAVVAAVAAAASSNKEIEYFANQNSIELAKDLYGIETAALTAGCLAKKSFSKFNILF